MAPNLMHISKQKKSTKNLKRLNYKKKCAIENKFKSYIFPFSTIVRNRIQADFYSNFRIIYN